MPSAAAHLLAEAVLEAARQLLLVAHAAGAAVLPANHLRAPVVMPVARRRVAAGAAHLLLKVERRAAAAAAGRVRLLDLHLVGLLGVRHGWRSLSMERAGKSVDVEAKRSGGLGENVTAQKDAGVDSKDAGVESPNPLEHECLKCYRRLPHPRLSFLFVS